MRGVVGVGEKGGGGVVVMQERRVCGVVCGAGLTWCVCVCMCVLRDAQCRDKLGSEWCGVGGMCMVWYGVVGG